jgi:hypothetical protein
VEDELARGRLERYEALLRERGIDPDLVPGSSVAEHGSTSTRVEVQETVWQLSLPNSTFSEAQGTTFKPQLLHGQRGQSLVDK